LSFTRRRVSNSRLLPLWAVKSVGRGPSRSNDPLPPPLRRVVLLLHDGSPPDAKKPGHVPPSPRPCAPTWGAGLGAISPKTLAPSRDRVTRPLRGGEGGGRRVLEVRDAGRAEMTRREMGEGTVRRHGKVRNPVAEPRPRVALQVAPPRHSSALAQRLPLRDTDDPPASARGVLLFGRFQPANSGTLFSDLWRQEFGEVYIVPLPMPTTELPQPSHM
jgi:hypothetical protein